MSAICFANCFVNTVGDYWDVRNFANFNRQKSMVH